MTRILIGAAVGATLGIAADIIINYSTGYAYFKDFSSKAQPLTIGAGAAVGALGAYFLFKR